MTEPTPELATTLVASTDDRLLQAEATVRNYCRWHIAPSRASVEETFADPTDEELLLASLHVTAIESVTRDGEVLDPSDYHRSTNGILKARAGTRWGGREIVVTYTHGHPEVPPEVAGVVQAVAQRAVGNPKSEVRSQAGPFSATPSQVGFNQAPALALLDAEKAILDRYRIPDQP